MKWLKLLLGLIICILILVCYVAYSIWSFGTKDETVRADAAIVLGAAVWDTEPSPVFKARIDHAIALYGAGYVDNIIFTGGVAEGDDVAESEVARDYALAAGVLKEHIFIETNSSITEENLYYAKEIAQVEDFETFLLVSDPLHMKRASLQAKHLNLITYSSPTTTSAYESLSSQIPFLLREMFYYTGYICSRPFR